MIQLTPKNDIVFKRIFGTKGNEDILKDFLSAVLGEEIQKVELQKDMTLERTTLEDKVGILDIKAITNQDVQINIEMQIVNKHNMEKRTLFYWSKLYTQGIKVGDAYYQLKKTITINLLDFNYFKTKNYHTKWHIVEDIEKDKMLTDVLEIHFIELPKFIKQNKVPENKKEEWLYFIDSSKREMVSMASRKNKVIEKAKEELDYLTGDELLRRKAELREKWVRDREAEMSYAREEGLRQGIQEGIEKGMEQGIERGIEQGIEQGIKHGVEKNKIETVIEMLKLGMEKEMICQVTKMSMEEVEKIQNQKE